MAVKINHTENIRLLFEGWSETLIWSCLQRVMGAVYADVRRRPKRSLDMH